jgi:hypothetical protein
MQVGRLVLMVVLLALSAALGQAEELVATASTSAGGPYGPEKAVDGRRETWWASADWLLPQRIRFALPRPQRVGRVHIWQPNHPLYARWRHIRLTLGNGKVAEAELPDQPEQELVFAPQTIGWLQIDILRAHQMRPYVGLAEIAVGGEGPAQATAELTLRPDPALNPARFARVTASSFASEKYGPEKINDGDFNSWWCSAEQASLPQSFRLEFPEAQTVRSVTLYGLGATQIYAAWKALELRFSDGSRIRHVIQSGGEAEYIEFAPRSVEWLEVAVTEVVEPKVYVSCAEVEINARPRKPTCPTIRDLRATGADLQAVDPLRYGLFGGEFAGAEVIVAELEATQRREKTMGVEVTEGAPRNAYFIALDLPFHPVVSTWSQYSRRLWPHMCGTYLDYYRQAAFGSAAPRFTQRFLELADFAVWSQYDRAGRSRLLDFLKVDYTPDPEYYGGWPTHDFRWTDGSGYDTPPYEPSHHMDAMTALGLINAYELSGERKYLRAAETFVRTQAEWFGLHPGRYQGKPTLWTEYNPTTKGRPQYDAVDNIVALFAAPTAAVGYHLRDGELLNRAEAFLWWMCKELDLGGRWYYLGTEWWTLGGPIHKQKRRDIISHEGVCLKYACWAYAYLRAAGRRRPDIEERLKKAAVFYQAIFGTCAQALQMPDRTHIRPREPVTFTTFIQLTNFCDRLLYKDTLPAGWPRPERLAVALSSPRGEEVRAATPQELEEGLLFALPGRPGDLVTISYALAAPSDFVYAENPFSPDLRPYARKEAPVIIIQGRDVVTGEWYQARATAQRQPLRTPSRLAAGDFPRLVDYFYAGQVRGAAAKG